MRTSVLLLTALLVLTGCGTFGSSPKSEAPNVGLYDPTGEGGDAALLTGRLETTSECFYVNTGETRYLPVFPRGSAETENGALIYRGESFKKGDEVSLTGGEVPPDAAAIAEAEIPTCTDKNVAYWIVAQDG